MKRSFASAGGPRGDAATLNALCGRWGGKVDVPAAVYVQPRQVPAEWQITFQCRHAVNVSFQSGHQHCRPTVTDTPLRLPTVNVRNIFDAVSLFKVRGFPGIYTLLAASCSESGSVNIPRDVFFLLVLFARDHYYDNVNGLAYNSTAVSAIGLHLRSPQNTNRKAYLANKTVRHMQLEINIRK